MEIILILLGIGFLVGMAVLAMVSRDRQAMIARRNQHVGIEVEVRGGRINVVELGGHRTGPCLVLLHGAGANLEDLRVSIGERLARDTRVLLIDRPGYGWSDPLETEGGATPEGQATAINQVLGVLGVDKPILVGHDVGGTVALAYALSYPEDVGGLVLISPLSHPEGARVTLWQRLTLLPRIGSLLAWLFVPVFGRWAQLRHLARAFAPQPVPLDYYDSVAADLGLRPAAYVAAAAEQAAMNDFLREQSQFYGQIGVPSVVVAGEDDLVISSEEHAGLLARELAGGRSDGRWVILNEIGHMPHHASQNVVLFEINRLVERICADVV